MKRTAVSLILCLLCAGALLARAQVVPSAYRQRFTLNVGGMGSVFQPDYAGNGIPQEAPNRLYGWGTYVDLGLRRWVQIEAEGRWLRENRYLNIDEDNYLIGARAPIGTYHRFKPYGKVLVGYGRMNFQYNYAYGRFLDVALGGGTDYELTRRISARVNFEYQLWPNWIDGTLKPYGGDVGIAYKIF